MPQHGKLKISLNASIQKKIMEIIQQMWKDAPKGVSRSLVVETILKHGLKDKEAIIKELAHYNTNT